MVMGRFSTAQYMDGFKGRRCYDRFLMLTEKVTQDVWTATRDGVARLPHKSGPPCLVLSAELETFWVDEPIGSVLMELIDLPFDLVAQYGSPEVKNVAFLTDFPYYDDPDDSSLDQIVAYRVFLSSGTKRIATFRVSEDILVGYFGIDPVGEAECASLGKAIVAFLVDHQ